MVMADDENSDFLGNAAEPEGRGGRVKCRGICRSAGAGRVEEVIERIHCLTAGRRGTVVCQLARIQLLL
jgi:hypothetical protein